MNKLGIKVYNHDIFQIDNISYSVNSISIQFYRNNKYTKRIINNITFGIYLKKNKL